MLNPAQESNRRGTWLIFCSVFLLAMLWAGLTSHVWEDYLITFRSSKNLATGHGLVFNHGDRLHTFTSPLGVLLPAAASGLTGNRSDEAALWIFRAWSALAFAGAAVLIYAIARQLRYGTYAIAALLGFLVLDGKSIDFTINGMETGFLLLFIAYALWAMLVCRRSRAWHLGAAWGGLMWTRPDSFLYIGLLSAGVVLFNDPERTGLTRGQWIGLIVRAAAVCTLLYLPWIVWAWSYYGTPVPNTIVAKGAVSGGGKSVLGLLKMIGGFPWSVWSGKTSLESTFLPSYFQFGGWPVQLVSAARGLAVLVAFQWILPWWRTEIRVASFTFCGLHAYLSYFPFFPFPWYLPGTALLAAVVLGGACAQLLAIADRQRKANSAGAAWWRGLTSTVLVAAGSWLAVESWVTYQHAREAAAEQRYSADGVRRQVGEWLKENARPADTVFMEPLGNIGFYSNLKTYDFPGLSSREVVEAIRAVGTDWGSLVAYLSPDWLVLRPHEFYRMNHSMHWLFGEGNAYTMVKEFNNLAAIGQLDIYGRNYVEFDAHLFVFKRRISSRYKLDASSGDPFDGLHLPKDHIGQTLVYTVHATGLVSMKVPTGTTSLKIGFGLPAGTYTGTPVTDGVNFVVIWTDGLKAEKLLVRYLNPAVVPEDRGVQFSTMDLPQSAREGTIILQTESGPTDAMDWSFWSKPEFL